MEKTSEDIRKFHERFVPPECFEQLHQGCLERDGANTTPHHHYQILTKRPDRMAEIVPGIQSEPLRNVWLGTSVESEEVGARIDELRKVPAAIRFISFEPLIASVGEVDLSDIHWAIVGGESGSRARPIREAWIDEIHNACRISETAFFFKQWGTWGKDNKRRSKKLNGRQYRGRTWDEMPVQVGP